MIDRRTPLLLAALASTTLPATVLAVAGSAKRAGAGAERGTPATDAFAAHIEEYLTLHRKLEGTLPKLDQRASPEEIDKNQRALGALIQSARADAKQGEFFTLEMHEYLRAAFDRLFAGTSGKDLLGSIMDENPGLPELAVNERYPDTVPLSTMPPELLSVLPELPEDMEYRFVGRRLVLLDAHAHIIVDFTDELLPG